MAGALGDDSCAPGLPSHGEHYFWVYPPQLPEPKRLSLTDTPRTWSPETLGVPAFAFIIYAIAHVLTSALPELSPGDLSSFREPHHRRIILRKYNLAYEAVTIELFFRSSCILQVMLIELIIIVITFQLQWVDFAKQNEIFSFFGFKYHRRRRSKTPTRGLVFFLLSIDVL